MADGVAHRFLGDPEQMHGLGRRIHQDRIVAFEKAGDVEEFAGVSGKFPQRIHQRVVMQLNRVEAFGDVSGQGYRVLDQADDLAGVTRLIGVARFELLQQHRTRQHCARQMLRQAIMQIIADPPLLSVADIQHLPFELAVLFQQGPEGLGAVLHACFNDVVQFPYPGHEQYHGTLEDRSDSRVPKGNHRTRPHKGGDEIADKLHPDTEYDQRNSKAEPDDPCAQHDRQHVKH